MPNYIRAIMDGGTYFFTVVTYQRQNLLVEESSRVLLRNAIETVKLQLPFEINAWVLLPDHLHCIWTLPHDDHDFSKRWGMVKAQYSKQSRVNIRAAQKMSSSRQKHHESTLWQRRFWEHQIRNERDYQNHMDYIHYNPVKHGLVNRVCDWPWSTFHRYVKEGVYPSDWGDNNDVIKSKRNYGE